VSARYAHADGCQVMGDGCRDGGELGKLGKLGKGGNDERSPVS
jgi:hypothetical protein